MKIKKILFLIGLLSAQFNLSAQSITITKQNVTYDSNFNPSITLTLRNNEDKLITNMIIIAVFAIKGSHRDDIFAQKYIKNEIGENIPSRGDKVVTLKINTPYIEDIATEYSGVYVEKVRFSDGTIK